MDISRPGFTEVWAHIDFAAFCECYPVPDNGMIEASFLMNINQGGLAKRIFLPYFSLHFILEQDKKCMTKSCAIESTGNQTKKWKMCLLFLCFDVILIIVKHSINCSRVLYVHMLSSGLHDMQ